MPYRIPTWDDDARDKWACPTPWKHRNWRVCNGVIECRQCGETFDRLLNLDEDKEVARENIEFVGPHADHMANFDYRIDE